MINPKDVNVGDAIRVINYQKSEKIELVHTVLRKRVESGGVTLWFHGSGGWFYDFEGYATGSALIEQIMEIL